MTSATSILQYFLSKSLRNVLTIEVIESRALGEEKFVINALLLKKKKNQVTIDSRINTLEGAEFLDWWNRIENGKSIPVLLLINSDKILHRVTKDKSTAGEAFKDIATESNKNQIYFQQYIWNSQTVINSLVRKSQVDNVMELFAPLKGNIVSIASGFHPLFNTYKFGFFPDKEGTYKVNFRNYRFTIKEDELLEYEVTTHEVNKSEAQLNVFIGNEKLSHTDFLSYSNGISYFLAPLDIPHVNYDIVNRNRDHFIFKQGSTAVLGIGLCVLLVILAISSIVYSTYRSKYEALEQHISISKGEWEKNKIAQARLSEQYELLTRHGLSGNSIVTYYSDQITAALPDYIYLTKLEIHPFKKGNDPEEMIFDDSRLIVEGTCSSSADLNEWLNTIRHFNWVKQATIDEFKQSGSDNPASFKVQVYKKIL